MIAILLVLVTAAGVAIRQSSKTTTKSMSTITRRSGNQKSAMKVQSDDKNKNNNNNNSKTLTMPPYPPVVPLPNSKGDVVINVHGMQQLLIGSGGTQQQTTTPTSIPMCICAKCGSTSFYHLLYQQIFGQPWPYEGPPYIHDTASKRWTIDNDEGEDGITSIFNTTSSRMHLQDLLDVLNVNKNAAKDDDDSFSLAIIRDPKQRLLSAPKSKAACRNLGFDSDSDNGYNRVKTLYRLANRPMPPEGEKVCLSTFEPFLDLLYSVHKQGKGRELDVHFRPQTEGCGFQYVSPDYWKLVTTIDDPKLLDVIQKNVVSKFHHHHHREVNTDVTESPIANTKIDEMPKLHASTFKEGKSPEIHLSDYYQRILDDITKDEYAMFSNYLQ